MKYPPLASAIKSTADAEGANPMISPRIIRNMQQHDLVLLKEITYDVKTKPILNAFFRFFINGPLQIRLVWEKSLFALQIQTKIQYLYFKVE
jgi:hypothetical protein